MLPPLTNVGIQIKPKKRYVTNTITPSRMKKHLFILGKTKPDGVAASPLPLPQQLRNNFKIRFNIKLFSCTYKYKYEKG
jgi:hypothetical protein